MKTLHFPQNFGLWLYLPTWYYSKTDKTFQKKIFSVKNRWIYILQAVSYLKNNYSWIRNINKKSLDFQPLRIFLIWKTIFNLSAVSSTGLHFSLSWLFCWGERNPWYEVLITFYRCYFFLLDIFALKMTIDSEKPLPFYGYYL